MLPGTKLDAVVTVISLWFVPGVTVDTTPLTFATPEVTTTGSLNLTVIEVVVVLALDSAEINFGATVSLILSVCVNFGATFPFTSLTFSTINSNTASGLTSNPISISLLLVVVTITVFPSS